MFYTFAKQRCCPKQARVLVLGRWYTDVKAWKVSRDDATAGSPPPFADQDRYAPPSVDSSPIGNDDIPF